MHVELVHISNEHMLLRINGDVLMENSKDFLNAVLQNFHSKPGIKQLSLDFSKVLFVDSSGIGALIKLTSDLKKSSANINVLGLNKNLRTVFQLSGIVAIIKVLTTEDFKLLYPEFSSFFPEI